jgi:acyl-CoA reductase-like NAD-dependent aldehyde dehydrogenase
MTLALKVINPYDQSQVGELPYDEGKRLDDKVAGAARAFSLWRTFSLDARIRRVQQGLQYFRDHAPEIAREITLQMGKPLAQALREVETFFDRANYMISIAEEALAPELLPAKEGFHRRIEHAPLGVILTMSAWNYPLLIPVNVVVPALLAGNVVLLKHSGLTPLCGRRFEEAFSGVEPSGLVTSLVLTHAAAAKLIEDQRIAHVAFTGSVSGGHEVYRAVAANRFIDVGLELGGKDPAYVAADADLAFAVANIVDGACYNAGQSCCAVERVYVHRSLYSQFSLKAAELLQQYRLGNPLEDSTTMGPLANRSNLQNL